MPTSQQMEMKIKGQSKQYGTKQYWVNLTAEDIPELFCADCRRTIERMLVGKWVYFSKGFGKGKERERRLALIQQLIDQDFDRKQIAEKMGFKSQQSLQPYLNILYRKKRLK